MTTQTYGEEVDDRRISMAGIPTFPTREPARNVVASAISAKSRKASTTDRGSTRSRPRSGRREVVGRNAGRNCSGWGGQGAGEAGGEEAGWLGAGSDIICRKSMSEPA